MILTREQIDDVAQRALPGERDLIATALAYHDALDRVKALCDRMLAESDAPWVRAITSEFLRAIEGES